MKTSNKKAHAFKRGAALITAAVLALALLFTACPNNAGGSGSGGGTSIISYVPVSYDKLEEYLTNQAGSGVTYIELTGSIPPADLKGSPPNASALGQKLAAAAPKKIGLKLPASAASVTDMSGCFTGCTNLVNVASLPRDLTDMSNCFKGCTALETLDAVSANVTNMQHCFDGCTNLKSVTLKCAYNPASIGGNTAFFAAFKNCTALKARSITVPYGTLGAYTDSTACTEMAVQADRFAEAAADFVQVDYENLDTHLTHNLTVGVNCIEITGTIPFGDLTGTSSAASALGQKLKAQSPAQFALKLPASIAGLTDMSYCFNGCDNVVSLAAFPEGVTNIRSCFSGCSALQTAPAIPDGVADLTDCFKDCARLMHAPAIPQGVTDIFRCFSGCTALTHAPAIPDGVTNMGWCFSYCSGLTAAPAIPASVTDMGWCFNDCTGLTQAPTLPEGVTDIGHCFSDCTGLTQTPAIPASVTKMDNCFNGCTALTGAALKCDYKAGKFDRAFDGCTGLTAGRIRVKPSQLTVYQNNAATMGTQSDRFVGDDDLFGYVKVSYADLGNYLIYTASQTDINYIEITDISAGSFTGSGTQASYLGKTLKSALNKKVVLKLPANIPGLTDMTLCFLECSNLVGLAAIPQGVTNMKSCFYSCTGLTEAPVIPASVTDMQTCFHRCVSLSAAPLIPASVRNMKGCFYKCTSLAAAPVIPDGAINMKECFRECHELVSVPVIPATVKNMESCFYDCNKIVSVPVIPASVERITSCFFQCKLLTGVTLKCNYNNDYDNFYKPFERCFALTAVGCIKVPADQLQTYKDHAVVVMGIQPDKFAAE